MNNLAGKLIENYDKNPEKLILVQGDEGLTYSDLYLRVILFKNYLKKEIKFLFYNQCLANYMLV